MAKLTGTKVLLNSIAIVIYLGFPSICYILCSFGILKILACIYYRIKILGFIISVKGLKLVL